MDSFAQTKLYRNQTMRGAHSIQNFQQAIKWNGIFVM